MIRNAQPSNNSSSVTSSDLARRVLRALLALTERGGEISVRTVMALVPASPAAVCAMLLALDAEGYVDGDQFRLTMRGFAAAHAPRAIAFERRRESRGDRSDSEDRPSGQSREAIFGKNSRAAMRKAVRVA